MYFQEPSLHCMDSQEYPQPTKRYRLEKVTISKYRFNIFKRDMNKTMHNRSTFIALMSSAIPPQADGDAIDVPFMSIRRWRVHVGTGATAAPGALIQTPRSPSAVGPRLDLHEE